MIRGWKPEGGWPGVRAARLAAVFGAAAFVACCLLAPAASAAPSIPSAIGDGIDLPSPTLPPITVPTVPTLPPITVATTPALPVVGDVTAALGLTSAAPAAGSSAPPAAATVPAAPATATAGTAGTAEATAVPHAASVAPSRRAVEVGNLRTGSGAVLHLTRSATAVLVLALAAAAYLVTQSAAERRNPRLAAAPIDRRDSELEFR